MGSGDGKQLGEDGQGAGCLPSCALPLDLMHLFSVPKTSMTLLVDSQGGRRSVTFHLWGMVSAAFPSAQAKDSRVRPVPCTLSSSPTCPGPILGTGETDVNKA